MCGRGDVKNGLVIYHRETLHPLVSDKVNRHKKPPIANQPILAVAMRLVKCKNPNVSI
jgi:hypothetical protein